MPKGGISVKTLSLVFASLALLVVACGEQDVPTSPVPDPEPTVAVDPGPEPEPEPEELREPLALWADGSSTEEIEGATAREEGYLPLDLGEGWTPYLFTDRPGMPNAYRRTYLSLARGEFPDDHHGDRARRDQYLELYGIMPTLGLLREHFVARSELECIENVDLQPLLDFEGFVAYSNNDRAKRDARRFDVLERQVAALVTEAGVADASELDADTLDRRDGARLRDYLRQAPDVAAIRATQERLECEGFFEGKGDHVRGAMDWATHEALAEFERRHRVYGWGYIGRETLDLLRLPVLEVEREAVLRVLTERGMHRLGVIEDGSRSLGADGEPRTYEGADGQQHPIRNMEQEIRDAIIAAFGLQTPESTLAWLQGLGEMEHEGHLVVAIPAPEVPEYYTAEMDLTVEIDRGDIWYEFPYDEEGNERAQPVQRRPRLTLFTHWNGQKIPLARYGTTVGGWRTEVVDGVTMWRYKMSEIGDRVWSRIVASPVWLPPDGTPPRGLLSRNPRRGRAGEDPYVVNYHETGPSYASAYGLVAAYHQKFQEMPDGSIRLGGDEGIRTHGSVDYMSIMRRHSHGCHRLHNHIALRLMSFVLKHRPHQREGQQQLSFRRDIELDGQNYNMAIDDGGYVFRLDTPLRVTVHEGRVRGRRHTPITASLPRFDSDVGAYVMPDGATVMVDRMGNITPFTPVPTAEEQAEAVVPELVNALLPL